MAKNPITVNVGGEAQFDFSLPKTGIKQYEFDIPEKGQSTDYPEYTGPTEVTPTQETQVLHTKKRTVLSDITINPIPNNYGLITWDGAKLTVS